MMKHSNTETLSFEDQMTRIEDILEKLNSQLPLEESVALYEEANQLLAGCESTLKNAETKVEKLIAQRNAQGEVESFQRTHLQEFDAQLT